MARYVEAAKRMFWPIISSTATTLCCLLPMLFWRRYRVNLWNAARHADLFMLSASLGGGAITCPFRGGVTATAWNVGCAES